MTSSWDSSLGPLDESGVSMIGSIRAWDSSLIFCVSSRSRALSGWLSFGSCFSEPGLVVTLGLKLKGISLLTFGSFGEGEAVSFGSDFSLSEGSSILYFSFSFFDSSFFSSLGPASKHCLHYSSLSSSGSYPRIAILYFRMCHSFMHVMASSNTFVSSKNESSGYTSWWYYVVGPSIWKCKTINPFGSCRRIGAGSQLKWR